MKITSQKIAANTALNRINIDLVNTDQLKVSQGKNVIFAIDVSGSMWNELPKIRQQLKNKIPTLISDKDTISIIWFSGKNEAGILQEGVRVNDLKDLQRLNDAIDRFLKPIGLTAFLPPLELTEQVVNNLSNNGNDFSFIFLSDGYNNDSMWDDIVNKLISLESKISVSTFIEYGYYADSNALTYMSEIIGGEKIFSKDFDSYEQSFDKIVHKKTDSKIAFDISSLKSKLKYQMFFTFDKSEQSITTYSCSGEKEQIFIPHNTKELYCISRYKIDSIESELSESSKLIAAYLTADKLKYNTVEDFLVNVGDVELLNQFSGAYGKQKLNDLKDILKKVAFDNSLLYLSGKKENIKIDPKQFCVLDLINLLQKGDNKFYPYHPAFNYERIGVKKINKVELTDEVKEDILKAKSVKEVEKITSQIETAEFIYPENAQNIGVSFNTLVWNKSRANLSVQTKLNGKVSLPSNPFGLKEIESFVYRNYTLIKDGVLNVTQIPVTLDEKTHDFLLEKGFLLTHLENGVRLLNISSLPIINRSMVVNVSGKKLAQLEFDAINIQLGLRYLKSLKEIYDKKKNDISEAKYSKETAEWLKSIGISDYNGFSPKREVEETNDFYIAPTLVTKIQNTSNLPTVNKVFEKIDLLIQSEVDGEIKVKDLTITESLMKSEIEDISNNIYINKFDYKTRDTAQISVENLNTVLDNYNKARKECLLQIAQIKFGVILSRSWFTEFETMTEDTLNGFKFKGVNKPLDVKFEFKEEKIKL